MVNCRLVTCSILKSSRTFGGAKGLARGTPGRPDISKKEASSLWDLPWTGPTCQRRFRIGVGIESIATLALTLQSGAR